MIRGLLHVAHLNPVNRQIIKTRIMTSFNSKDFRKALGTFATGITVVTTFSDTSGPVGITVNSFTSVSLEPPLVLWCLDNNADSYQDFANGNNFAIHVLHEEQKNLSDNFAFKDSNKFSDIEWATSKVGTPVLRDFSSCFECEVEDKYSAGDHLILLGRVLKFEMRDNNAPLIYYEGNYQKLKIK